MKEFSKEVLAYVGRQLILFSKIPTRPLVSKVEPQRGSILAWTKNSYSSVRSNVHISSFGNKKMEVN